MKGRVVVTSEVDETLQRRLRGSDLTYGGTVDVVGDLFV